MIDVVDLSPGMKVWLENLQVTITGPAGLDSVLVDDGSGQLRPVAVSALSAGPAGDRDPAPDLLGYSQEDWDLARRREHVLRPLLDHPARTVPVMQEAADQLGCSLTLAYRLLNRYADDPRITALLPQKRGKPAGLQILASDVEQIIAATIDEMFMTRQQAPGKEIAEEVRRRCRNAGISPPGVMTVYRRLNALPPKAVTKARQGRKAAQDRFEPSIGQFPETHWPLQVIQIDHTPVDAFVVDQVHRREIGRPILTLAIDIYSRMVVGFLLSLDPPSATSVALCIAHAVTPKDDWLAKRKVDGKWPVWGVPDTIHVDNGKEFHSEALRRGCEQYGITLDYRPVRTPRYGGHIERLIGTFMGKVHLLPGTTFSNVQQKGDYRSAHTAVLTLPEMEEWLTVGICVYHSKIHSALGIPPLAGWEKGILGTEEHPGRGLPARIGNPERLLIDFLPFERRNVTREGVVISHIHYWSDVLRPLINDGNLYMVRYDPRDLSRVWFLSKDGEYYQLPYKARHRPPISLWEQRAVRRQLREEGRRHVDENAIFEGVERMRAIVDEAAATTRKARRQAERRRLAPTPIADKAISPDIKDTDNNAEPAQRRVPKISDAEEW